MWLLKDTPGLFTDLYELTMAQAYFRKGMNDVASFEVAIRRLPKDWGFFVMAGLAEIESYLGEFRFSEDDIEYLVSTGLFGDDFLEYLASLRPDVKLRAVPEGAVFFPNEPFLEVTGPLIISQLLESYILNILGYSIIEASLGARIRIAAGGAAVIDFGLRRCQGPVASVRSARGAQIASLLATSNVFAARALGFPCSGTMAHSYIQVHENEEEAFADFVELYGEKAILLVDTYDCKEGIRKAARVAGRFDREKGLKIKGIRIDSGDLAELGRFAREHFVEQGVGFLRIFVSGDLDEFKIADLVGSGAEIDGFGVGTRFAVSRRAPAVEIVYKLCQYAGKGIFKTSPGKKTLPGRKSLVRIKDEFYEKDIVQPFDSDADDLLAPFKSAEGIETVQRRLSNELSLLKDSVKAVREPQGYEVSIRVE